MTVQSLQQRITKQLGVLVATALMFSVAAVAARDDKKTNLTVHESIEVPGAVLLPGDYVVKLVDSDSTNHIVQFTNADETEVISTVIAIPNQRLEVTGETKFRFWETPAGDPPALRAWFYPGDLFGQEFAYPETRAGEIARHARRNVPAVPDDLSMQESKASSSASATDKNDKKAQDPIVLFREVTVIGLSPDAKKTDWQTAAEWNAKADRKAFDSSRYLTAQEMQENRVERASSPRVGDAALLRRV